MERVEEDGETTHMFYYWVGEQNGIHQSNLSSRGLIGTTRVVNTTSQNTRKLHGSDRFNQVKAVSSRQEVQGVNVQQGLSKECEGKRMTMVRRY